jgi:hypothetical protein
MEVHGRVAYDANGKPARVVGVNIDISNRKLLEEQLHQAGEGIEVARMNVLKATMRTVEDIGWNALMSLSVLRAEVKGRASQEALVLLDQTIFDTATKLKALGDLNGRDADVAETGDRRGGVGSVSRSLPLR